MTRLDRHILVELTKSVFLGSALAVVVLIGLQALRLSEFIIRFDLDGAIVTRMLTSLGLSFLPLVVPIACLFAFLIIFGRMSTDRELVAAQAMGWAPPRILRPGYAFGLVAVLFAIWFSFSVGPAGNRGFEATIDEAFKRKVAAALRSGTFTEGFLDMVLFVDHLDPVTGNLERVFVHDSKNFQDELSISATRGQWIEPSAQEPVGILKLIDGVVVSQDPKRETVRRVKFDEYRIFADFTREAGRPRDSPPSLDAKRLLEKRAAAQRGEISPVPIWIEIARRFGVSFACFLFVPLAFGLSVDNRRTARSRAVMTGLLVLFGYWTLYFALVTWLLRNSQTTVTYSEPFVWAVIWIPNFLLAIGGWWLLRRRQKLQ